MLIFYVSLKFSWEGCLVSAKARSKPERYVVGLWCLCQEVLGKACSQGTELGACSALGCWDPSMSTVGRHHRGVRKGASPSAPERSVRGILLFPESQQRSPQPMPTACWLSRKAARQQWLSMHSPKISAAAEWLSMLGGGHGMRGPAGRRPSCVRQFGSQPCRSLPAPWGCPSWSRRLPQLAWAAFPLLRFLVPLQLCHPSSSQNIQRCLGLALAYVSVPSRDCKVGISVTDSQVRV